LQRAAIIYDNDVRLQAADKILICQRLCSKINAYIPIEKSYVKNKDSTLPRLLIYTCIDERPFLLIVCFEGAFVLLKTQAIIRATI